MKQMVLVEPGKLEQRDTPKPSPTEGEVLIKVHTVGICGSDVHAFQGKHPTIYLPVVQGHEFSGVVEVVGHGVLNLEAGDRVTVRPQVTCGKCYHCLGGHSNICHELQVIGCNRAVPGAAQEYIIVPSNLVYRLPEALSFEAGAFIEPVSVAVAAIRRLPSSISGKSIVILGAGTIGNLTAQVAKANGAKSVLICDIWDEKLAIARNCGLENTLNVSSENAEDEVLSIYGRDGLDVAFECVGIQDTINFAISVCRKRADIVIVGVFASPPAIDMINIQEKELGIYGTLMYKHEDYDEAIRLIEEKRVSIDALISGCFPLSETANAYEYILSNQASTMKVLINVGE